MDVQTLQIIAIDIGGIVTGAMFGSGMYKKHHVWFALNMTLFAVNSVRLAQTYMRSKT